MPTILYSTGRYTVRPERFGRSDGFAIYRDGATAAERCAQIGASLGLARAIAEADRRAAAESR